MVLEKALVQIKDVEDAHLHVVKDILHKYNINKILVKESSDAPGAPRMQRNIKRDLINNRLKNGPQSPIRSLNSALKMEASRRRVKARQSK